MKIRLTRLSNERHRFEIVRDDGSRESHELETRSTLLHDLAHYAVEVEAGLMDSFYGRLARGLAYSELVTMPAQSPEAMQTELVVVQVQNTYRHGDDAPVRPAQSEALRIASGFAATGSEPPPWLTDDFISRVRTRLWSVQRQWRATPFHQTMELRFPGGELPPDGKDA
jgi:hypothetical protein